MASVNKTILLGNCGKDPELRYLPNGDAATRISLATTSKYKNKSGESVEDTQWHSVTFFGRLAEIVSEYVKKGSPVYIEGRLKYGKYTDKEGIEKYTTEIVAQELQLLGSRPEGQQRQAQRPEQRPAPQQRQAQQAAPQQRQAPRAADSASYADDDSDIPF